MRGLDDFFSSQLQRWPLAKAAYSVREQQVLTRSLVIDGMEIRLQHNPARAVSTGAKIDAASIAKRPCFLCAGNRPQDQGAMCFSGRERDYEVLVNPFPIADKHLTIASVSHEGQDNFCGADMACMALNNPDWIFFYNGAKAGASAPDHLHFQAVNKSFLNNLMTALAEANAQLLMADGGGRVRYYDLPMQIVSVTDGDYSLLTHKWVSGLLPINNESGLPDSGLRNIFMYADSDGLHTLIMSRRAHRPDCYFAEGQENIMCSPGGIDMAGTLVLPRREDFDKVTVSDVRRIYYDVSLDPREIRNINNLMLR